MIIEKISELTAVKERGIIINYNTKNIAFLALLSTMRYANIPVLLIDCESTDGSFEFFKNKMDKYNFDLLSAPLKTHGLTLDWIFSETKDEKLLLIDSDLEILNNEIILFFNKYGEHSRIFGCGFVHGHDFLRKGMEGTEYYNSLFFERPFMPIVLLKTHFIKEALAEGCSFNAQLMSNEFTQFPGKLKWLQRFIKPRQIFRKRYYVFYPEKVFYDTGAKMYEFLRYKKLLFFAHLPHLLHRNYVYHLGGTTRTSIDPNDKGYFQVNAEEYISNRLRDEYSETLN